LIVPTSAGAEFWITFPPIGKEITIAELAQVAALSTFHFVRIFTRTIGISPRRYVSRLRIENSMAEITAARSPLAQVAFNAASCPGKFYACVSSCDRYDAGGNTDGKLLPREGGDDEPMFDLDSQGMKSNPGKARLDLEYAPYRALNMTALTPAAEDITQQHCVAASCCGRPNRGDVDARQRTLPN
jgi:Bacterial regulatory helix-turn-helix proteins, AraC family